MESVHSISFMSFDLLTKWNSFQSVAEAAEDVWDRYGFDFGTDYSGLFVSLSHVNYNVRIAAGEALAAALDENPDSIQVSILLFNFDFNVNRLVCGYFSFWSSLQETLSTLFSLYIRDSGAGGDILDPCWLGRQGIALALHSSADVLRTKDLPVVMTFLISRALVSGWAFCFRESCLLHIIKKKKKKVVFFMFSWWFKHQIVLLVVMSAQCRGQE